MGYLGDMVADELDNGNSFGVRFEYITNTDYLGSNAISLYKAMEWAQGEPVVLCMGDHIIGRECQAAAVPREPYRDPMCRLPTGTSHQADEVTKVTIDTGCIQDIGKDLTCWDALDNGIFLLTEDFF